MTTAAANKSGPGAKRCPPHAVRGVAPPTKKLLGSGTYSKTAGSPRREVAMTAARASVQPLHSVYLWENALFAMRGEFDRPEWSECVNERHIRNVWCCARCDYQFETSVYFRTESVAKMDVNGKPSRKSQRQGVNKHQVAALRSYRRLGQQRWRKRVGECIVPG